MNTLVIEKLKKDDLKEAISIYDMNHNIKTNYEKLVNNFDKINDNPDYHNIVAKLDNKIVGFATIVINHDIVEELKPFLTVWNFGVHKDYRRNKIGTRMFDYIYDFAKKLDCDFISFIAETENVVAQNFYESLGYIREVGYVKLINKEKW